MATATILPQPRTVFLDAANVPLAGGTVYTYVPNTTNNKTSWQDAGETTPNTNPITLDSNGSCLLYGSGQYTLSVYDSLGNLFYTGLTQDLYSLVNVANVAYLNVQQSFTAGQAATPVALTDASTISVNFGSSNNFSVTLGGNRTLANPSNQVAGQSGQIAITQDGTGTRTLAYGGAWCFAGGITPTLSTAAASLDILAYYTQSATSVSAVLIKALAP